MSNRLFVAVVVRASIALLAVLLLPAALLPAETIALTEESAVERALEYNLGLASNRQELLGQERKAGTAWNVLLPDVTATAGLRRSNEVIRPLPPAEEYYITASGSVEGRLALSLAAVEGIETARLEYRAGEVAYREAAARVEQETRKSFYNLILLQEQLAVAVQSVDTAHAVLDQAQADYQNGFEPELTLRQAEISLQNAELNAERRATARADAVATFKRLVGLDEEATLSLRGSIAAQAGPTLERAAIENAIRNRLDIQSLDAQIALQESVNHANALKARTPTLTLSARWNPVLADPFDPDNTVNDEWVDQGSVGISLSFGLDDYLPFSQSAVSVQTGRRTEEALRLSRQDAMESARNEVDSLIRSLESSMAALDSLSLSVALAEEVYTLTEEAYLDGARPFVDLLEAEEELRDARTALLSEQYSYLSTIINLEFALNRPIRNREEGP